MRREQKPVGTACALANVFVPAALPATRQHRSNRQDDALWLHCVSMQRCTTWLHLATDLPATLPCTLCQTGAYSADVHGLQAMLQCTRPSSLTCLYVHTMDSGLHVLHATLQAMRSRPQPWALGAVAAALAVLAAGLPSASIHAAHRAPSSAAMTPCSRRSCKRQHWAGLALQCGLDAVMAAPTEQPAMALQQQAIL